MKVELINSFIKASIEVLGNFVPSTFSVGKPYKRVNPFPTQDIVIYLGITGDYKGQATLSLSDDMARMIASNMMMGMEVNEIDDMAKSALSELGNMIMGNSATLLFNEGTKIDITPPSLMTGSKIEITASSMETICVPLNSDAGTIEFDIGIKVK